MIPFRPSKMPRRRAFLPLLLLLFILFIVTIASNIQSSRRAQPLGRRAGHDRTFSAPGMSSEGSSPLFDPKASASGLRRTSSSPDVSKLSTPDSYETARTSEGWSPASGSDVGHAGSIRSEDLFGPLDYPSGSTTPSSVSASASHSSEAPELDVYDRLNFSPKAKDIRDDGGARPSFEVGESSSAASAAGAAPGTGGASEHPLPSTSSGRKELPAPLRAQPFPDGSPDPFLVGPANQHIHDAIAALPPSRDTYQLVSMRDPGAPGGFQVYRVYKMADGSVQRVRVHYVPPLLHDVKAIEDARRASARTPEDARRAIQRLGWEYSARPTQPPGQDEFSYATATPNAPTSRGAVGRTVDSVKQRVRTGLSDLRDVLAVGRDRRLEGYHTTGGVPAVYGREEIGIGKTIPAEARRIAQETGEARIFYNPFQPTDQVRITYNGRLKRPGAPLAPESAFRTYIVPENRALPLPRHWREANVDRQERLLRAMERMNDFDQAGGWSYNRPSRWPTSRWDPAKAKLRQVQSVRQKVGGWFQAQPNSAAAAEGAEGAAGSAGWRQKLGGGVESAWQTAKSVGATVKDKVASWIKTPASGAREAVRPVRRRR